MRIHSIVLIVAGILSAHAAVASQIAQRSLAEVAEESAIVLVGVVEHVREVSSSRVDGVRRVAQVRVISHLRGRSGSASFELTLHTGGLRGFDAALSEGDQAVFFLRSLEAGKATLQSWGSVALLPTAYFHVD